MITSLLIHYLVPNYSRVILFLYLVVYPYLAWSLRQKLSVQFLPKRFSTTCVSRDLPFLLTPYSFRPPLLRSVSGGSQALHELRLVYTSSSHRPRSTEESLMRDLDGRRRRKPLGQGLGSSGWYHCSLYVV